MNIDLILYIAAAICFGLAAFKVIDEGRISIVALGLLLFTLAFII